MNIACIRFTSILYTSRFLRMFPSTTRPIHGYMLLIFNSLLLGFCLNLTFWEPSEAQSLLPGTQLSVFDSKDNKVGHVLGVVNDKASPLWVAFTIDGHLVTLGVTRDRLTGPEGVEAYYSSQECAGEPHFKHSHIQGEKGMLATVLIGPPGRTVYIVDDHELSLIFYPQSRRKVSGSCERVHFAKPIKLRPGKGIINLQEVFVPPFHIR